MIHSQGHPSKHTVGLEKGSDDGFVSENDSEREDSAASKKLGKKAFGALSTTYARARFSLT